MVRRHNLKITGIFNKITEQLFNSRSTTGIYEECIANKYGINSIVECWNKRIGVMLYQFGSEQWYGRW